MAKGAATSQRTRRAPVVVRHTKKAEPLGGMQGALKYLYDRIDIERTSPSRIASDVLKLDRMHLLMKVLDNPHQSFRSVHVAGTKGKGSTCEMTAACLEACGYAVGVYTSPHLVDIRERIRINRKPIGQGEFVRVAQRVADAAANLPASGAGGGEPTFFELMTAMGFVYFAEQAVDVAVVEVGLGGRLDSTNVITPEVSAITHISKDHVQILGETLEKIALEKAGIFKPGVPALTIPQTPGVMKVLRSHAEKVGAPFMVVGEEIEFSSRFVASPAQGPHMRVCLSTPRNSFEHLPVPLQGEHQAYNCGLALAILDKLCERGFSTPENKVTKGLAATQCAGRMELAWASPRVLLDGAHNTESVKCLMKSIGAHVPYDSMVVVFGCAADKDIDGMLRELGLGADKVIFTKAADNARAADPRDLQRKFSETTGKMSQTAPTLPAALGLAQRAVARGDLICVTGSFYLVGEAKKHLATVKEKKSGSLGG